MNWTEAMQECECIIARLRERGWIVRPAVDLTTPCWDARRPVREECETGIVLVALGSLRGVSVTLTAKATGPEGCEVTRRVYWDASNREASWNTVETAVAAVTRAIKNMEGQE